MHCEFFGSKQSLTVTSLGRAAKLWNYIQDGFKVLYIFVWMCDFHSGNMYLQSNKGSFYYIFF